MSTSLNDNCFLSWIFFHGWLMGFLDFFPDVSFYVQEARDISIIFLTRDIADTFFFDLFCLILPSNVERRY
jgi:hypothetical protein